MQDVVYYFEPAEDCTVNISLCSTSDTSEPLDTIVFLLSNLHSNQNSSISCNDDFCGRSSQLQVSPSILRDCL